MQSPSRVVIAAVASGLVGLAAPPVASGDEPERDVTNLVELDRYMDVEQRAGQDPSLTLVVAISGGGYRAANFALGALLALEQIGYPGAGESTRGESNLLNEVDYLSTVSGGGLAAAMVVMSRLQAEPVLPKTASADRCSGVGRHLLADWMTRAGVAESLRENHTSRLITSKFALDVAFTSKTSGDALQMRLDESILSRGQAGGSCGPKATAPSYVLGDVLPQKTENGDAPVAPYWFMNATDMATGGIVPFTPGWIERELVARYWHGQSRNICRAGDGCGSFDVPIAVALRSSMNFPAGIPPTSLERTDGKYVYLTDGGESDNLGTVTAAEILNQEGKLRPTSRRMLIVIDAFRGLGREEYGTAEMPGLFNSVLRATSLPLDAHRFRVRRDFYHATTRQPSVLDALSETGDVWVAYVDMARELDALEVGTNLRLSPEQQEELICAGKRQALVALVSRHT